MNEMIEILESIIELFKNEESLDGHEINLRLADFAKGLAMGYADKITDEELKLVDCLFKIIQLRFQRYNLSQNDNLYDIVLLSTWEQFKQLTSNTEL